MLEINLSLLFQKHWGDVPQEPIEIDGTDSRIVQQRWNAANNEKYYEVEDLSGKRVFMPVWLGGLFLPYVWLTITGGKHIVETYFTERRGSVKEIVNERELLIEVQGFFVGTDGAFPEEQVQALRDVLALNEAVEINCPLTDIFLLQGENDLRDRVLITDWKFLPNRGVENVKAFELAMVSDAELELEIPEQ